jgi:hypothetical protein
MKINQQVCYKLVVGPHINILMWFFFMDKYPKIKTKKGKNEGKKSRSFNLLIESSESISDSLIAIGSK